MLTDIPSMYILNKYKEGGYMYPTRIKYIRQKMGITQVELSKMVDLSQAEVSRKENGITAVSLDDLNVFAKALGVNVSDLLKEQAS